MLEKNHRKVVFLCVQELTCHVILLSSFVPPYSYGIVYFNLSTFFYSSQSLFASADRGPPTADYLAKSFIRMFLNLTTVPCPRKEMCPLCLFSPG